VLNDTGREVVTESRFKKEARMPMKETKCCQGCNEPLLHMNGLKFMCINDLCSNNKIGKSNE